MSSIKNEEHSFVEKGLKTIYNEHLSLEGFINDMVNIMNVHLSSLKPLEELFIRLNTSYDKFLNLEEDILKQETSLNGMVNNHMKIVEYTQQMQKTSKDIFELMKLVLMNSIVSKTNI